VGTVVQQQQKVNKNEDHVRDSFEMKTVWALFLIIDIRIMPCGLFSKILEPYSVETQGYNLVHLPFTLIFSVGVCVLSLFLKKQG
jgi:hypothetical protein